MKNYPIDLSSIFVISKLQIISFYGEVKKQSSTINFVDVEFVVIIDIKYVRH